MAGEMSNFELLLQMILPDWTTITVFLLLVKFTWSLQSEPNLGEELRRVQAQDGFSREKKVTASIIGPPDHSCY